MSQLRVVSYGLGPIGLRAAALAARKDSLDVVGAIDIAPDLANRDLGEIAAEQALAGVTVSGDAETTLRELKPDAVIHCTSSFLPTVEKQLTGIVAAGVNAISSTEELLWPSLQHPDIASRLDAAATSAGKTILGTGVNPGFVMDTLPAFAGAVCYDVERVECRRYVDATTRRLPFQKKIGAGLSESEFRALVADGKLGHIGLRESIALLGAACGFELDTIEQDIEPILATRDLKTEHLSIASGEVAGIHNTGFGARGSDRLIEMDLRMFVGCENPHDAAILHGTPGLHVEIPGGTSGDLATAAMLVNGIPGVVAASPGVRTMLEVPVSHLVR